MDLFPRWSSSTTFYSATNATWFSNTMLWRTKMHAACEAFGQCTSRWIQSLGKASSAFPKAKEKEETTEGAETPAAIAFIIQTFKIYVLKYWNQTPSFSHVVNWYDDTFLLISMCYSEYHGKGGSMKFQKSVKEKSEKKSVNKKAGKGIQNFKISKVFRIV